MTAEIRIGSRGSALAMAQAELVRHALAAAGRPVSIVVIETEGDRRAPDTAWGEGAFVAAIERALLDGRVDVAVHSAKDIPTDEDRRLSIAGYLPRADARDALVVRDGTPAATLDGLPSGSRVGTDSPRRTGFVRARRPDLVIHPIHGNVDTRLRRLDAGETDALVLACAGLDRLGRSDRINERLEIDVVPPAPGQGAIAIQVRSDDARLVSLGESIDDRPTRIAVEAERAFLRASGGGCRAPIGAHATVSGGELELFAGHVHPDGSDVIVGRRRGGVGEPDRLGAELAAELGVAHRQPGLWVRTVASAPRVLVTRAAAQAGALLDALRDADVDPIPVPAIEIELAAPGSEIDRAVERLNSGQWVVITSPNGARATVDAARRVGTDLRGPRWAAIGDASRAVLESQGVEVSFVPSDPNSAALAAELPVAAGERVAVFRGDLAAETLVTRLRSRGAVVDDVIAYRTIEAPSASRPLLRRAMNGGPIAAAIFTSGSTVRGLQTLAQHEAIDLSGVRAICIGRETAEVATRVGFHVVAVSPTPDPTALAQTTATAVVARLQETA